VTFFKGEVLYKFFIPKTRGRKLCPVSIVDENGTDMYNEVLPYLGPNYECYIASVVSPSYFECKKLTFTFPEGHKFFYDEMQPIIFSQS